MPQVINTNIASLNAQRNLSTSQSALSVSLQRLSSGLRINSAKDDAAGLAISERMTSQVRGLNQAVRNANDGISLAQTAESALGEIGNLLQRMRELSIQSANATNSDSDRVSLQQEVSQLKAELTRIAGTTTFNGQKVLNGALQNIQFQVGAEANQTIGITIGDARSASIGSRLVTTNNTSNGLQTATNFSRYATAGASVGYAQAIAADIATAATNGYGAQTLTIKDASGTVLQGGLIKVNANDQASTIAARLNAVDGGAVRAEGYTSLKLANLSSQSGGNDAITLNLQSGTALSTFTLTGVDTSSSQANLFAAIQNAVNGDADLKAAGVVAGIDGANNLVIRNNTGADIAIDLAIASGTVTVDAYGSDTGNTHVQLAAAGNGATRVGGQLSIFLANGYTVESDAAADYLFDAATNASVVAAETNVGIGTVTTQDTRSNLVGSYGYAVGKANASTGAATNGYGAQILRIRDAAGSLVSGGSINVAVSSEANTIAGLLNAVSGVNTTASTKATLSSWAETGGASGTVAYALDQTTVVAAKSWNGYTESQAFEEI
ncbi:MAG: hypothetical protein HZC24_02290, partial [Rhodocyclales bacterium]|nr:hypothetical protein [Rhodocyclales bacterium]